MSEVPKSRAQLSDELEQLKKENKQLKRTVQRLDEQLQNEKKKVHPCENMSFYPFADAAEALGYFFTKSPKYTQKGATAMTELVSQLIHLERPPSLTMLKSIYPLIKPASVLVGPTPLYYICWIVPNNYTMNFV